MTRPTAVLAGVAAERGLGAALCGRFAQDGCHVLVAGQTPAKIGETFRQIHHQPRSTCMQQIDLQPFEDPI